MNQNRINAGKNAKKIGHENEIKICEWLNENFDGKFVVDGASTTKKDIIELVSNTSYSLKSVKKNHTQCHLTSSERWCEHFNIDHELKSWFMQFFGVPGIDISEGKSRRHRLTKYQINSDLNDLALNWFNDHKIQIFDMILRGDCVDYLIWYQKLTKQTQIFPIDELEVLVYDGNWILNETTLHFLTENQKKMFHLQMKGSGKKYTSSYHGLMFHIHKCF
jgi:hypothetical protein